MAISSARQTPRKTRKNRRARRQLSIAAALAALVISAPGIVAPGAVATGTVSELPLAIAPTANPAFSDVPADAPFFAEIDWLVGKGITTGYGDGTFRPKNQVTREAMAAFLYRLADEPEYEAPAESEYSDVDADSAFFAEIHWLAAEGITDGYSDGTFRPKNKITREAMAAFLNRFKNENPGGDPDQFIDIADSSFAAEIAWLVDRGVTTGYCDGTFRPKNKITREATAAFLYRLEVEPTDIDMAKCDEFVVGSKTQVPLRGRGFGHGIGMSQYGAQGAAREGENYQDILSHYYPGTKLESITNDELRVWIEDDDDLWMTVKAQSGMKFEAEGESFTLPTKRGDKTVKYWRVAAHGGDNNALWYKTDDEFERHDKNVLWDGVARLTANDPLTLILPNDETREYRGSLTLVPDGPDKRLTINEVKLEEYLRGVVPREMPASWETEALKSQAVAARTYSLNRVKSNEFYDLCDSTSCQVYRGDAGAHSRTNAAITATAGEILLHNSKPAFTQYSSSSGGYTAPGGHPYLIAQRDPWDGWSGNTNHEWSVSLKVADIEAKYPEIGTLQSVKITDRNGHGDMRGRVGNVQLKGTKGSKTRSGSDFRFDFGLKSHWFGFNS